MAEETEEKHLKKTYIRKIVLIFFVFFIFVVSGFFLIQNILRKKPPFKPSQPIKESVKIEPPPPTVENTEKALLRRATLVFPNITSSTIITVKQIPKNLLTFLKNTKNENFKIVHYENGKTGYLLDFEVDLPLADVYRTYVFYLENETRWQILYRERANLFAFIEAENENYKIRISQKYLNQDQTLIEIKVISK
jgi:hypothetical protein